MKNGIVIAVALVLAAGIGSNIYLYSQQSNQLRATQAQVAALQEGVTGLTGNVSSLHESTRALSQALAALAASNSALRGEVSTLRSDVSGLARDAGSIRTDISGLAAGVSGLSGNISTLKGSVDNVQQMVADNARAFQAYTFAAPDTAAKLAPVMVRVDATGSGPQSSGSGTIVNRRGYILTVQHVVAGGQTITVTTMSGEQYRANLVSADPNIDLALLRISTPGDLAEVVLGSPTDVIVGREVLAIGFALGPNFAGSPSVTRGIISARRTFEGSQYIQTDAAINPGNSGGCLVTFDGKMIGVPSARIQSPDVTVESIGLAVTIEDVQSFLQKALAPLLPGTP